METTPRSCIDCGTAGCNHGKGPFPDFCLTENLGPGRAPGGSGPLRGGGKPHPSPGRRRHRMRRLPHSPHPEIGRFAQRIGCRRVGIATCVGLINEARLIARHLRLLGLEVYGVGCKVGMVPKHELGLPWSEEAGNIPATPSCKPRSSTASAPSSTWWSASVWATIPCFTNIPMRRSPPPSPRIGSSPTTPAGALYTGYYKNQLFPGQ